MLTFDINQSPPTVQQIEQEKARLQTVLKNRRFWALMIALASIVILMGMQIFLWKNGIVTGEIAVAAALTGVGFIMTTFYVVFNGESSVVIGSAGAFVGILGGMYVVFLTNTNGPYGVGAGCGAIAGLVIGIFVGEVFGARIMIWRQQITSLVSLPEADKDRCPNILALCRQDEKCEGYRLTVAQMDRSLVATEADMIEKWVANIPIAKEHQSIKEACLLLQSKNTIRNEKKEM